MVVSFCVSLLPFLYSRLDNAEASHLELLRGTNQKCLGRHFPRVKEPENGWSNNRKLLWQ